MAFGTAEENVANKQNHGFNQSDIYIIFKKYIIFKLFSKCLFKNISHYSVHCIMDVFVIRAAQLEQISFDHWLLV